MFCNSETFWIAGNLHVNFAILVYSATKITSLFYPVAKFSHFCICDTPLNCYYFTHQSYPFAHLTSFRRITKFTTVYGRSVIQNRHCIRFSIYIGTDWVRLNFFSKNRMHKILELELLNKPITTAQFSNEITITVINMGRKFKRRTGSPSNTKSPGLRPTSIPSGMLMHPAIWPQ